MVKTVKNATERAQLFLDHTEIDRHIVAMEQIKSLLEQIPQTYDLSPTESMVGIDKKDVIRWIDHNIDKLVTEKMNIHRAIVKSYREE